MTLNQKLKIFGAAASLAALSALGAGSALAAPIFSSATGNIDGFDLGSHCTAVTCVNLDAAGYDVAGGGVVDPSGNRGGFYLTPGSNSSDPGNTASYNVTSTTSQDDPAGSNTVIVISNLGGQFDFYWGSVDRYNVVEFFSSTGTSQWVIDGADLADALGLLTNGPNFNFDRYVNFVGEFDSVKLSSTGGAAFEVAAAVPEPGTLALLGLGLMGIGFARRRASV